MNIEKIKKLYNKINDLYWSGNNSVYISWIMHGVHDREILPILSAGNFYVSDNQWNFFLPKMEEVENADGMIHVTAVFLNPGAINWDDVTEDTIVFDPNNIEDMRKFLSYLSKEITLRDDWSLMYTY